MLFETRNALVHNSGDMALNKSPKALAMAKTYLADSRHCDISPNLASPFFSLMGSKVRLSPNIYFAIRLCMR
jgi:hypothetical protein